MTVLRHSRGIVGGSESAADILLGWNRHFPSSVLRDSGSRRRIDRIVVRSLVNIGLEYGGGSRCLSLRGSALVVVDNLYLVILNP